MTDELMNVETPDNSLVNIAMGFAQQFTGSNTRIARLHCAQPGKKYSDKGAVGNDFVIDFGEGEIEIVPKNKPLRVSLVDGPINARVMWAFRQDGTRITSERSPWCATSDGVLPRSGGTEPFIGREYTDWRTGNSHIISTCEGCPFQNWIPVMEDGKPKAQLVNGKLMPKNAPPPCNHTPVFILWDHDRELYLLFQASNSTVRVHTLGATSKSRFGYIQGIPYYYSVSPQTKLLRVMEATSGADGDVTIAWRALMIGTKFYEMTEYNTRINVPVFTLGAAITEEEKAIYARAKNDYTERNLRSVVTGQTFVSEEEDEAFYQSNAPSAPSTAPF